jgi:2-succinyl-5-enolpyruvyl-6-hydroxy-3-cyclohexene-1-carboxylate synthase
MTRRSEVTGRAVRIGRDRTVVIGTGIGDAGVPVLADPRAGIEGPCVVQHADAILRTRRFAPDTIVRVGPQPASRIVNEWASASGAREVVVGPAWRDPSATAAEIVDGVMFDDGPDEAWMAEWRRASDAATSAIAEVLDEPDASSEPFVARTLLQTLPSRSALVVASSMPVRDLEWYAAPRADVRVLANRGANGIDGTISTAIGVALATRGPTVVLVGDIAFLHDSNALIGLRQRGVDLTIVVVDNDGGGIFSFLPQATALDAPTFETLFGTPHGVKVEELAAAHGIASFVVQDPSAFAPAVRSTLATGGVWLVIVRTERAANVKIHQQLNEAVARALDAL